MERGALFGQAFRVRYERSSMHIPSFLVRPLLVFLVLGVFFHLLERFFGCRPQARFFRRGWMSDALYLISAPVVKVFVKASVVVPALLLTAVGVASPENFRSELYAGFGPLSRQPLWIQTLEIYLLVDLSGYWIHRLFHARTLWPFHAVHHSSEELDWLASLRVHPFNELTNRVSQVTPVLLLGLNPVITLASAPFLTLYAIGLHANFNWDFGPLRAVLASPVFHRWHHSRSAEAMDKNFAGLLPLWDILFGTYYMPRDRFPDDFGTHESVPQNFWAQMVYPVRAMRSAEAPRSSAAAP